MFFVCWEIRSWYDRALYFVGFYWLWIQEKDASGSATQVNAELYSPAQLDVGPRCVSFHYQLARYNSLYPVTLSLSVAPRPVGTPDDTSTPPAWQKSVWSSTATYGYRWTTVKRTMTMEQPLVDGQAIGLIFRVATSKFTWGMVAIDDVQVTPGVCSAQGTSRTPNTLHIICFLSLKLLKCIFTFTPIIFPLFLLKTFAFLQTHILENAIAFLFLKEKLFSVSVVFRRCFWKEHYATAKSINVQSETFFSPI